MYQCCDSAKTHSSKYGPSWIHCFAAESEQSCLLADASPFFPKTAGEKDSLLLIAEKELFIAQPEAVAQGVALQLQPLSCNPKPSLMTAPDANSNSGPRMLVLGHCPSAAGPPLHPDAFSCKCSELQPLFKAYSAGIGMFPSSCSPSPIPHAFFHQGSRPQLWFRAWELGVRAAPSSCRPPPARHALLMRIIHP